MYLRGLTNIKKGNSEKAKQYFELGITEDEIYYPAQYKLAQTKYDVGQYKEALTEINALLSEKLNDNMAIKSYDLKAQILIKLSYLNEAKQVYQSVLKKYHQDANPLLNKIRLSLSYLSLDLLENNEALTLVDQLLNTLQNNQEPELMAEAYLLQAKIHEKLNQPEEAKEAIENAHILYNKLGDINGKARVHRVQAKIAKNESNYS